MLPLYEPVRLGHMKFFFISAVGVVGVTTVAIADDEGLEVARELATQSLFVRTPDFVDHMPKILRNEGVAVGMNLVARIANFNAGARISALCVSPNQRKIEFAEGRTMKCLKRPRVLPIH